jgi:hypothetical protein
MKLITEPSKSKYAVVGIGLGQSEGAFSTDAGDMMRAIFLSQTVFPHYVELRKDNFDDEEIPDELKSAVYSYLADNGIEKVILLGSQTARQLAPSLTAKSTIAKLNSMPFLGVQEFTAQAAVIHHPRFVVHALKNNPDSEIEYSNRIQGLLKHTPQAYNIHINSISIDGLISDILPWLLNNYRGKIGVDFETNGEEIWHKDFKITLFSLSMKDDDGSHITWWIPVTGNETEWELEQLRSFFLGTKDRLWAFNCPFEMKVFWRWLGVFIGINDSMVLITMESSRSSLKDAVRRHLASDFWEAEVHEQLNAFSATFKQMTKMIKGQPELIETLRNGGYPAMEEIQHNESLQFIRENHEDILEDYGIEELARCITGYPYHWAAVPHEILGPYCCRDSAYGVILAEKFEDKFRDGYPVYIRHPWLATVFESYGITYDRDVSYEEQNKFTQEMIASLNLIIQDLDIPIESKMKANDILSWNLPHTIVSYTEKTKKEKRRVIKDEGDRHEELKGIFNPASNHSTTRDMFWNHYLDESIEMATILWAFVTELRNRDIWPEVLKNLSTFSTEEEFLRSKPADEMMDSLIGLMQQHQGKIFGIDIQNCLVEATNNYKELYTGRFARDVMEAQYKVHTYFFGVNVDDKSTWNPKFELLFNLHKWKKLAKTVSTYITGSIGRDSVYLSKYDPKDITKPPIRIAKADLLPLDYQLKEDECWVFNVGFNSLSAITHRWSSGAHTIPSGSSVRRMLIPRNPDGVWFHADFSQAELVILSFFSQDPKMLQVFLSGGDMHRYVASQVFKKPEDEVTSEERRGAKAVSFGIIYGKSIESTAVEIFGGDVGRTQAMFDAFFLQFPGIKVWMEERYKEVDTHGKVTNMFGALIQVETDAPGNAKYRQGCNYPIQSSSSMLAGTSMWNLHEHCQTIDLTQLSHNFTHDALDSECEVRRIFDYTKALRFKMQDELYEQLGAPMRIDHEVGINCFHICGIGDIEETPDGIKFELEGTQEAVDLLLDKMNKHSPWVVDSTEIVKTKELYTSWDEMFTTKSAYKSYWGVTQTKIVAHIQLKNK